MGWNCTIAVVAGATLDDLARLGWRVTDRTMAWDEATFVVVEAARADPEPAPRRKRRWFG